MRVKVIVLLSHSSSSHPLHAQNGRCVRSLSRSPRTMKRRACARPGGRAAGARPPSVFPLPRTKSEAPLSRLPSFHVPPSPTQTLPRSASTPCASCPRTWCVRVPSVARAGPSLALRGSAHFSHPFPPPLPRACSGREGQQRPPGRAHGLRAHHPRALEQDHELQQQEPQVGESSNTRGFHPPLKPPSHPPFPPSPPSPSPTATASSSPTATRARSCTPCSTSPATRA
jgi:hypothetical protein